MASRHTTTPSTHSRLRENRAAKLLAARAAHPAGRGRIGPGATLRPEPVSLVEPVCKPAPALDAVAVGRRGPGR